MKKIFLLLLVALISLDARENPFFVAEGEEDIPITSNKKLLIAPLKQATITLPSTARVIEGVTVRYKTLDGAQHTKTIELENSIDWHLPIFISQSYQSINQKSATKIQHKKSKYHKILSLPFISFYESQSKMKIITKDKMLRNFMLVKPHRIVCDFQRQIDIRSYNKNAPKDSKFTQLRIGTHKGYYRVVINLDGYYTYKMKETSNGYMIELH